MVHHRLRFGTNFLSNRQSQARTYRRTRVSGSAETETFVLDAREHSNQELDSEPSLRRCRISYNIGLPPLCALCDITRMARGPSGRIVVEVDPALKRELHAALAADGATLKDWFLIRARSFVTERRQPSLPGVAARVSAPSDPLPLAVEKPQKLRKTKHVRAKIK